MYRKTIAPIRFTKRTDNFKCFGIVCLFALLHFPLKAADRDFDVAAMESKITPIDQSQQQTITVTGVVKDMDGEALPGVTIALKSNLKIGQITDRDGKYVFTGLHPNDRLVFTFIGMEPVEVTIQAGKTFYNVTMRYSAEQLQEVVVETGLYQRDRVNFTGAASSYTGSELRTIGNQNLLESLKVIDPAFVIIDNYDLGSNPNAISTIELRGQGSATINAITDEFSIDPNRPLFVINGIESSFSRVKDLDINRIESITILKDAGSTAIYGSKGANGVIVIETTKPKSGELRLYYSGDYAMQMPDLTVYNLMNSSEKLEFERLSGKYTAPTGATAGEYQKALTELYNTYLADIRRGVDTYWLNEPLRTAFTHGHSIRVSAGDDFLLFDIGGKLKYQEGVMKKSGRDTWGGDIGVTYRKEKLIVSNVFDISGYTAPESTYGNFSEWAKANPYFRKRNEDGSIEKFLQYRDEGMFDGNQSPVRTNVPNPLHNAQLNSKDESSSLAVVNSFSIQYLPIQSLRLKAGIDLSTERMERVNFISPEHTKYHDLSMYYQGQYSSNSLKSNTYKGYLNATFIPELKNKHHSILMFLRGDIQETENSSLSVEAEGFPYGSRGTPNLAYSYKEESSPGYGWSKRRQVGFLGTFDYDFDKRYVFNAHYRIDGATTFGSNKKYKSFWSVGLAWNIDKERFLEDLKWIDILKLRATTGSSGNQNQGKTVSETIYQLYLESNIFGQGLHISDFANPNLPWQVVKDYNIGMDLRINKGQFSLRLDAFNSKTDPNIIFVPQTPSTGVNYYPMALGHLTKKGIEFELGIYPIYNLKERILWGIRITGLKSKSTYGGLGNALNAFNEQQRKDNTLVQYRDGYSPTDIWAVRSYGIDPADGGEIFIKKNGKTTKEYDAEDMVVVGNERPDLTGVISSSFRYRNFSMNVAFRYSFGGDIYNSTLYGKVENITKEALQYNQDKRALYDRWKRVGDITKYKSIAMVSSTSNKTSRFVQKNNYLNAESISLSYEINNNEWLSRNLSIRNLRVTGYLNDIFRLETSKTERGISYPFARSASIGLNVSF